MDKNVTSLIASLAYELLGLLRSKCEEAKVRRSCRARQPNGALRGVPKSGASTAEEPLYIIPGFTIPVCLVEADYKDHSVRVKCIRIKMRERGPTCH